MKKRLPGCLARDREYQEQMVMAGQKQVYYCCKKMLKQEDALNTAQETLISRRSGPKSLREPGFGGMAQQNCGQLLRQCAAA